MLFLPKNRLKLDEVSSHYMLVAKKGGKVFSYDINEHVCVPTSDARFYLRNELPALVEKAIEEMTQNAEIKLMIIDSLVPNGQNIVWPRRKQSA